MNPLLLIIAVLGAAVGGLSTIYLVVSLVAVIIWKFYRRMFKGIPLTK